ncbi:MAG: response regulator transcription factor [Acidobacteriota bacterium]|nr:response regulator transcription factor [Acidobacteriota bacterium]
MISRVLLADDHALVRNGVRRIIESHPEFLVVAEVASGIEAVEAVSQDKPDIAVLDIAMKGLGGIGALETIVRVSPLTRVLIVSMHSDERYVRRAVRSGASGYVVKESVEDELIAAMLELRAGREYFSPSIRSFSGLGPVDERMGLTEDSYSQLTTREREIYQLLAEGRSNEEIADLFSLSPHTVKTHRARIMEKLGIHTAAELVISAVRRGLVA